MFGLGWLKDPARFWKIVAMCLIVLIVVNLAWTTFWTLHWYKREVWEMRQVQNQIVGWINQQIAQSRPPMGK
jgi:hypothetical protein